jgi:hypothetical protein
MEWAMKNAVNIIVSAIWAIFRLVMDLITYIDVIIGNFMKSVGIPASAQPILLIIVAILLIVLAVRLLSLVIAVLIIVLLVLLITNRVDPQFFASHDQRPVAHLKQDSRASTP